MFRGPLVVQTLAAHYTAMCGAVKVPSIADAKSDEALPYNALAMATASVCANQ
jgi:hypothetical protein